MKVSSLTILPHSLLCTALFQFKGTRERTKPTSLIVHKRKTKKTKKQTKRKEMETFDRSNLQTLAVSKLQWTSHEAKMATTHVLATALLKANVPWSVLAHRPRDKEKEAELEREKEREREREERDKEPRVDPKSELKPELKPDSRPESRVEAKVDEKPELDLTTGQQMPTMAETLANFETLFGSVKHELESSQALQPTRSLQNQQNSQNPPALPPPYTTHDIAQEITCLKANIKEADEGLQRRRVVYVIMCHDRTGAFTEKHIEAYKRMLTRNEQQANDLRQQLQEASTRMHDATRVRQTSGDRMFALNLIDKATLSEWESFNRDMQELNILNVT